MVKDISKTHNYSTRSKYEDDIDKSDPEQEDYEDDDEDEEEDVMHAKDLKQRAIKSKFDKNKFTEYLAELYPSKYSRERAKYKRKNKIISSKNGGDELSKDKQCKDKQCKDKQCKDKQSKDKVSKDKQSKDKQCKDKQSKDKQSKDKQCKDKQSKDKQSKDKLSKDKPNKQKSNKGNSTEILEDMMTDIMLDKLKKEMRLKKNVEESDEEYDDSDEEYYEESDEEYYDEDDEEEIWSDEDDIIEEMTPSKSSKFNIIFTLGRGNDEEYYDDDYDEDYEDDYDEDYEDDYEEDDDDYEDEEEYSAIDECCDDEEDVLPKKSKSPESVKATDDSLALKKMQSMINNLSEEDKKNGLVQKMIKEFKELEKHHTKEEKKKTKKVRRKNTNEFRKLLKEKNVMNDVSFFNDKLTPDQQKEVIKQIKEIKKHCEVSKPYRLALLDTDIPTEFKACAYKKISTLRYMEPGSGEYYKMKQWVDAFMQIPFGVYKNLPLTMEDGVEKCHEFMDNAKQVLDTAVYGLEDAKLQIMQMVGQWIANPSAVGNAIAIKGPMGTGKTTLVKEGISQILGRNFAFIALGGATDSSVLEGHSYTYEGSTWGKIVDIILQCKNMNPVIYFDELDKVSDTPKGEEIVGILTHLTDTSQNSKFHDKFFSEIDFDLSRCLFIFSYNDESRVNPILLDRMYRIQTKGYEEKEKIVISKDYLLPKIREQVRFEEKDINIPDETLKHMIANFTNGEDGVRNLKRCLEIVYTKLNLYRLMKPGSNIFEKDMDIKIEFPVNVTPDIVDKLIKKSEDSIGENARAMAMYM